MCAALVSVAAVVPQVASAAAVFSEWSPSSGATMTAAGRLQVRATTTGGETISLGNSRLYLDGVQQSLTFFSPASSVLLRTSTNIAPPDGLHTLRATVLDSGGGFSEDTWTFNTQIPPRVYQANPLFASVTRPKISFFYSDNGSFAGLRVRLVFDGVEVYEGPHGIYPFSWTPPYDLANNSNHTVLAEVTDPSGNVGSLSWSFNVVARPAMDSAVCEECHTGYPTDHSLDNCGACHPSLADDYGGDTPHGPIGYLDWYGCSSCHTPSQPAVPQHGDVVPLHTSSTTCGGSCHDTALITEHAKYPSDSEFKYQCVTCHTSTSGVVQDAIVNALTACESCHPDYALAHGAALHASLLDAQCAVCHGTDAVALHDSCDTCHPGGASAPAGATCITCHSAIDLATHGAGPFFAAPFNTSVAGYLSWDSAAGMSGNTGASPHGGYTANTNKCAVCHSVHQAQVGGSVLTAFGPYETYSQGCVFCHGTGATFTDVRVVAFADGSVSPHATCTRCHAESPHAVGTSEYATLAARMLGPSGDVFIGADLAAGANGLSSELFDATGSGAATARGVTLGTGYLCSACHRQSFAVNLAGTDPAGGGAFTGHRVPATATADWDQAAFGGSLADPMSVAWADAAVCAACHDAQSTGGDPAFPHGYVDAAGAASPKTAAGSSYVWLTTADHVAAPHTLLGKVVPETGVENANLLTEDGLCLKCHRDGAGAGVGLSF